MFQDDKKEILKAAIDVTKIMQESESIMILRTAELDLIQELKSISKDIDNLQRHLTTKLPELPDEEKPALMIKDIPVTQHREVSDIDKLKAELAAIESRLKEL